MTRSCRTVVTIESTRAARSGVTKCKTKTDYLLLLQAIVAGVLLRFAGLSICTCRPVIDQNLYYAGMKYTTATFATAMTNILPAITFCMAWILRYNCIVTPVQACRSSCMDHGYS
ncbi:hypothetical protein RJ639_038657 [Escallonia herrerae]|uniref:WAT1-related protein n=1 Tax=Escallonia herrerae TaxID=1293975 RepID=A0AA89B5Q3_9ASTE|nr:hypothetical protein RJ639_038657 [Escallonia herrerae]